MKYKVGDTVRIRKDLDELYKKDHNFDYNYDITREMLPYSGMITEIVEITSYGRYRFIIDNKRYSWVEALVEGIYEKPVRPSELYEEYISKE